MWEPVSTERLSAYLDGELSDDERQLVEQQLAESEQHRQILEELEALRADLKTLPSFAAPPDLQSRIAAQIAASKSDGEPAAGLMPGHSGRYWKTMSVAAAALAAAIAIFLLLPGPQPPVEPPSPRPVPVEIRQTPQLTMVYDIRLTLAGMEKKVLERMLDQLGISIDPTMKMAPGVERELTALFGKRISAARIGPYKQNVEIPKDRAQDEVEVLYLAGTLFKIDQLGQQLRRMVNSPQYAAEEVADFRVSIVFEQRHLKVMKRLHESAVDQYVNGTVGGPSDGAYGFKLDIDVRPVSAGVPGALDLLTPSRGANTQQSAASASSADAGAAPPVAEIAELRPDPTPEDQEKHGPGVDLKSTAQVLIFVRKPQAVDK